MKKDYEGRPFSEPQCIPGRILCACYDVGGEGVAYHDTTPFNHGSGSLNPADGSFLNEFRMNENVDISYMKPDFDATDENLVQPPMEMLYVGWTAVGEWQRYTVNVKKDGIYGIDILYSAERGGKLQLDLDDEPITEAVALPITHHPHHWNQVCNWAEVSLTAGLHVLTLNVAETGYMNYACLDFHERD